MEIELPHEFIKRCKDHIANGGKIRMITEVERRQKDREELVRRRKAHLDKCIADIYKELGKDETS